MIKKVLSIILSIILVVSTFSICASAEVTTNNPLDISFWQNTTPAQIQDFIDNLDDGEGDQYTSLSIVRSPLITDISSLIEVLPNLQTIVINYCSLNDISCLSGYGDLDMLDLEENFIYDISPIQSMGRIGTLNLEGNLISDVKPLVNNESKPYHFLSLDYNLISDVNPLKNCCFEKTNDTKISLKNNYISVEQGKALNKVFRGSVDSNEQLKIPSDPFVVTSVDGVQTIIGYYGDPANTDVVISTTGHGKGDYVGMHKAVTDESGITEIGDGVFKNNDVIKTVSIGNNIEKIGSKAFAGCTSLTDVTLLREDDITVASVDTFEGIDTSKINLHVDEDSAELYKNADVWKDFNIISEVNPGKFDPDNLRTRWIGSSDYDKANNSVVFNATTTTARIYTKQLNGYSINIDADKYDFITDKSSCYDIYKGTLSFEDYGRRSFEITAPDGSVVNAYVQYPVQKFNFEQARTKWVSSSSYDEGTNTLTLNATTTTARIYAKQLDGAQIKIDTDKYDFITAKSGCYDIKKGTLQFEDFGQRKFEMVTADGSIVNVVVQFPIKEFDATQLRTKWISGYDFNEEENTLTIDASISTARIYEKQLDGAMIKIDAGNYDFITPKSGCYDIRQLKAETREFDIITADGTMIHTIVNFPAK